MENDLFYPWLAVSTIFVLAGTAFTVWAVLVTLVLARWERRFQKLEKRVNQFKYGHSKRTPLLGNHVQIAEPALHQVRGANMHAGDGTPEQRPDPTIQGYGGYPTFGVAASGATHTTLPSPDPRHAVGTALGSSIATISGVGAR